MKDRMCEKQRDVEKVEKIDRKKKIATAYCQVARCLTAMILEGEKTDANISHCAIGSIIKSTD